MFSKLCHRLCCRSKTTTSTKPTKKTTESGVYVLQLNDNKYYVGQSDDIPRRIWSHENFNGSGWTKRHKFQKRIQNLTKPQSTFWELWETLEQMKDKGIENVRGSMFTNPNVIPQQDKIMAAQLYCEIYNLCRKCGRQGHFITSCSYTDVDEWVHQFGSHLCLPSISKQCQQCHTKITSPKNYKYCYRCHVARSSWAIFYLFIPA